YACPLPRSTSFSATVTSTRRHGSLAKLGAPSASGFIHGSSSPTVPGRTNAHIRSTHSLAFGSRISDSSGSAPQKKGWISTSPLMAAPPPSPSSTARTAIWCTMLAPALSPVKNTRPRSPHSDSHASSAGRDATHRSAAHESSELRFSSGDSGSEPLTDVSVDMESSFGMATKFNGVVDNRLVSLKYPLWRPEEYERGVRSSGVALPADSRRGAGVMNPFT
ncbi:hypothetical protein BHE74_00044648, partial [Ensete ventricosum]